MAAAKRDELLRRLLLFLSFSAVLLPSFLTAVFLDETVYNNSSDTFLYLDIARHLYSGEGFICTFNVYQFWKGIAVPALPFVHVGLSVLLAAAFSFGLSVKSLILGGFLPAIVNGFLIAAIAMRIYRDRGLAFWASVIVVASVCTQITLLRILTEQWSLLITLSAVLIFVSRERWNKPVLAGLAGLLFLGVMVRSAAAFYPYVFALAMFMVRPGETRPWRHVVFFVCLSIALLLLWEGSIFLRYGSFFPQYPLAFKNYFLATRMYGGLFLDRTPALFPVSGSGRPAGLIAVNAQEMLYVLFCILRVLAVPALWAAANILRRGSRAERLLLFLAAGQLAAHLVFYPYMRIGEFSWTRFLLLPVVCLLILGGWGLRVFCVKFLPKTGKALFHIVFAVILFANMYQSVRVLEVYWQEKKGGSKEMSLKAARRWILSNTEKDDLIATSEYVVGNVCLERPIVVLPSHNILSSSNLKDYLMVFSPRILLFEYSIPLDRRILSSEGFIMAPGRPPGSPFFIYRKAKDAPS